MKDADDGDEPALFVPKQNSLLHSLEQKEGGIDLYVDANRIEFTCFEQKEAISTVSDKLLKLVDQFTYLSSNISSTERDVNIRLAKVWNTVNRLSIIWKSDLSDKIKLDFLLAVIESKPK